VSTKEEQKSAFLMKRLEFRTYIRRLADSQREQKDTFRQRKASTTRADRQQNPDILNGLRTDIVHARANIRYALLAYAMFRGKPYAKVEQKTKDKPDAYLIWSWFKRLDMKDQYDKPGIELWLSGGVLPRIDLPSLPDMSLELPGTPFPETVGGL
jgi:hypothetical protein